MTSSPAHRRPWPAPLLAVVFVLAGSLAATSLAADEPSSSAAPASPAPSQKATPAPTPYPEFDPSAMTVRTDLFSDGYVEPVYIADDGVENTRCLYVVERAGVVRLVRPTGIAVAEPFLDIRKRVNSKGAQQGLLGIAFHPDFANNGRYFVHYTDKNDANVIAEYKGEKCRPGGKGSNKQVRRLFTVDQQYNNNNAGWIGFGPDGMLYVPLGDGGGPEPGDPDGVGQTPATQLAKVLRVDVDRKPPIPLDNPYVRVKKGKIQKKGGFFLNTWAWGLRDPRRASFDRETGDFWIGDVGQVQQEVDLVPAGSVTKKTGAPNFGWSDVEGADTCQPAHAPDCDPSAYVPPVYAYERVPGQVAITGGYVYRGEAIPELRGVYLFSDFRSGYLWALDADAVYAGHEPTVHRLLEAPQGFVSFGEDDDGELYLVALGSGSIYRIGAEAS